MRKRRRMKKPTQRNRREVKHLLDESGRKIVKVPLSDQTQPQYAILSEADFNSLIEVGLSPVWCLSHGMPHAWVNGLRKNVSVARLIMNAGENETALNINGDPFDLRREE